ncbi:hypothetical protein ACFOSW_02570 [Paenibacillus sp. GCM10012303]
MTGSLLFGFAAPGTGAPVADGSLGLPQAANEHMTKALTKETFQNLFIFSIDSLFFATFWTAS